MEMLRVTARWTGFTGAPGYSNFFFANDAGFWDGGIIGDAAQIAADDAAETVRGSFTQVRTQLPSDATITVTPQVDIVDSDTGEILGAIDHEVDGAEGMAGTGGYSAASGAVVNWRTSDYRFGRRIRGRTFLVPIVASAYEDDGTLTSDALSDFRSFGSSMLNGEGSSTLGVWSRPRNGAGGVFATINNAQVPDKVAVLRSRRD